MATVTGLTAERMLAIEAQSIVDGAVVGDNLILTRFDDTDIDAGNVRGPMGLPGDTPVGSICDFIGLVAPTNWLLFGATYVNGQTLYPGLWALLPATMKSGSSIILPAVAGKVVVAYDASDSDFNAIGDVGGSKTHTLTQAQLPAAPVTVNPPNTDINAYFSGNGAPTLGQEFNPGGVATGLGHFTVVNGTGQSTAFDVDIPQFNSGNMGSGASHPIVQPFITFQKIIRAL